MAASRDLRSHVTEVVMCPICLEPYCCPKSLPCLHTFCLKCIEGHCRANVPGDEAACPVCRQKFVIPVGRGVGGLICNFFIADLVEIARKTTSDVVVAQVSCEPSLNRGEQNGSGVAASTMDCVDCNQKPGGIPHGKTNEGPLNEVQITSGVTKSTETQVGKCGKHKNYDAKLHCFDCEINICAECFADEHRQHNIKSTDEVAVENLTSIDADIDLVLERVDKARNEIARLDEDRRMFLSGIDDAGEKIMNRSGELKQLVDKQVDELMMQVRSLKTETCKEIECQKENIEMKLLALETFSTYCSRLRANDEPCDITRAVQNVHIRTTELLYSDVTLTNYCAPVVTFRPMNIHELLAGGQNLVGVIKADDMTDSIASSSAQTFTTERDNLTKQQLLTPSAETERSLRRQIEACCSQSNNDKMWTQKVNELQARVNQLKERQIEMKAEKVESEKAFKELSIQLEQVKNGERGWKVKIGYFVKEVNSLKGELQQMKTSESELKTMLRNYENKITDLDEQREELKSKLKNSEMSTRRLEELLEDLRGSKNEGDFKLDMSEKTIKCLDKKIEVLEKNANSFKEELKTAVIKEKESRKQLELIAKRERLLLEHLQFKSSVVHALPEAQEVCGVTSLDDELYVVRLTNGKDQVEVYNTTTTSSSSSSSSTTTTSYGFIRRLMWTAEVVTPIVKYSLLRQMSVPGLKSLRDMASCKHHRCLYIADYVSKYVHKVELNGKVTKWPVTDEPWGLSVTSQLSILVACHWASKLIEYSTDGKQLREINLEHGVVNLWHAIQLSNGDFVVCHGDGFDRHRVCIVGTNGRVTQSCGELPESSIVGQLNRPCHLAVDKAGFVYVADCINRRVLLLSPTLSFVREILSIEKRKWKPSRLCLDVEKQLLYVADNEWKDGKPATGRLVIVQLQ